MCLDSHDHTIHVCVDSSANVQTRRNGELEHNSQGAYVLSSEPFSTDKECKVRDVNPKVSNSPYGIPSKNARGKLTLLGDRIVTFKGIPQGHPLNVTVEVSKSDQEKCMRKLGKTCPSVEMVPPEEGGYDVNKKICLSGRSLRECDDSKAYYYGDIKVRLRNPTMQTRLSLRCGYHDTLPKKDTKGNVKPGEFDYKMHHIEHIPGKKNGKGELVKWPYTKISGHKIIRFTNKKRDPTCYKLLKRPYNVGDGDVGDADSSEKKGCDRSGLSAEQRTCCRIKEQEQPVQCMRSNHLHHRHTKFRQGLVEKKKVNLNGACTKKVK